MIPTTENAKRLFVVVAVSAAIGFLLGFSLGYTM
jgi:hypothetical protein